MKQSTTSSSSARIAVDSKDSKAIDDVADIEERNVVNDVVAVIETPAEDITLNLDSHVSRDSSTDSRCHLRLLRVLHILIVVTLFIVIKRALCACIYFRNFIERHYEETKVFGIQPGGNILDIS